MSVLPLLGTNYRTTLRRNDAVFADNTILLASGDDLPGQQQKRPLGIVDQYQSVHLRPSSIIANRWRGMAPNQSLHVARFRDNYTPERRPSSRVMNSPVG